MKREVPEGLKVRYVRGWTNYSPKSRMLPNTSRYTSAIVIDENDAVVAEGHAVCCPRDHFNKRLGREIALGRALKTLRLS